MVALVKIPRIASTSRQTLRSGLIPPNASLGMWSLLSESHVIIRGRGERASRWRKWRGMAFAGVRGKTQGFMN